jgi:hypothetical protein
MSSAPDYEEWLIASVLTKPAEMFILWAIWKALCNSLEDFRDKFQDEMPIDHLVRKLEIRGLLVLHSSKVI